IIRLRIWFIVRSPSSTTPRGSSLNVVVDQERAARARRNHVHVVRVEVPGALDVELPSPAVLRHLAQEAAARGGRMHELDGRARATSELLSEAHEGFASLLDGLSRGAYALPLFLRAEGDHDEGDHDDREREAEEASPRDPIAEEPALGVLPRERDVRLGFASFRHRTRSLDELVDLDEGHHDREGDEARGDVDED